MSQPIEAADLYILIRRLVRFPNATICRHAVALDLFALLERAGYPVEVKLAQALVDADDEAALAILNATPLAPPG